MIYRPEHPKPQFEREGWENLNGVWQFDLDRDCDGVERRLYECGKPLDTKITVPFCPQSELSGIGEKDFMKSVWYKRTVEITEKQLENRVFLHFGAVDYIAEVYVNGKKAGRHIGGYVSFKLDITELLTVGKNELCLHATDDERSGLVPCGKQSSKQDSYACFYTRTTGIWQTVWLEFVPNTHIKKVKYYPNTADATLTVVAFLQGAGTLNVKAYFDGRPCAEGSTECLGGQTVLTLKLVEKHIWELGKGGLYDLVLTYGDDEVKSYFGLRDIAFRGKKFYLNGKSVLQRLILDQGFYPDGIYTAPSDEALAQDIDLSMAMGFNGARLHEKVFEERFLYHADRKGYIVWGEYPGWGLDHRRPDAIYSMLPEWLEEIDRDFNHPAIVGWCPQNETADILGKRQFDPLLSAVYLATKAADPTRPCIDTSGYYHVMTDIHDIHDYCQDPEEFKVRSLDKTYWAHTRAAGERQPYDGVLPYFVSEYGGIQWTDKGGWGYGNAPQSEEEFLSRIKGLTDVILDDGEIFALCYTQLTDVEQEQNGLYTYDRKPKFPPSVIAPIFSRKAKIED